MPNPQKCGPTRVEGLDGGGGRLQCQPPKQLHSRGCQRRRRCRWWGCPWSWRRRRRAAREGWSTRSRICEEHEKIFICRRPISVFFSHAWENGGGKNILIGAWKKGLSQFHFSVHTPEKKGGWDFSNWSQKKWTKLYWVKKLETSSPPQIIKVQEIL